MKATQFAAEVLDKKSVDLVVNQSGERDSFGRLLAYVIVDGEDFNAVLVERGYARVLVEYPNSRESEYLALEAKAVSEEAGLWGCGKAITTIPTATPEPTTPTEDSVTIRCIFYDGLVPRSEADEYVELVNTGNIGRNLSGWILRDVSKGYPSYIFPEFELMPGQRVRVYTNQVHEEWGGFTFSYDRAIWNNADPDSAALFDSVGREISRKSYPPGC